MGAMGFYLRVGDPTTCGGKILTGDETLSWYGVAGAREGDVVSCGQHPGTYRILGGTSDTCDEGRRLAGTLDSVSSCPCRARFIQSIPDCYIKDDTPEEQAEKARLLALVTLREEQEQQKAEEKRLAEERDRNRVFAKSCLRGEGCNDAGEEQEPHTNFASLAFYQSLPSADPASDTDVPQHAQTAKKKKPVDDIPKPKKRSALYKWLNGDHEEIEYQRATAAATSAANAQMAVEGASILGLVGGSAITSGTWAVRGATLGEIAAAGPGAFIAAIVVGMMPGRLNEGEQDFIDRMRLEQMREAPSRVRYTWEQDDKGNLIPHGWHTPPGKDMVRVRKMAWDSSRKAYTFTTEEDPHITIIWTPDSSGVNVPSNTGNQNPVRIPNPVVVDPLPENTRIEATTSPAPEEKNFADYIIILPISDIPPIYIYLSKRPEDPIWTQRRKITQVENAYNHWKKHGSDFPDLTNSKEYVDATHDFVNNPPKGTMTKTRDNGDILLYHPESNTLGIKSKDGAPRTMFKPTDKMDYWNDQ
ncbi:S-type pyocin domain-containing protein [Citrobacter braakii]|uniref:S-type pyocin domain-containing protein n=1 Tax=Citrobacter braakii TaxID=57706 RepID=UPI002DB5BF55|nr:S-type pyocin domain-containing protein [Citrobacter braakii]MEB8217956.1 S-type pyocin domain-containing protein [Citrobacter braakii]MEB8302082.1 S-type pyocin domain-containing protein [Citrobacter braakii]